eukprot:g12214.t1
MRSLHRLLMLALELLLLACWLCPAKLVRRGDAAEDGPFTTAKAAFLSAAKPEPKPSSAKPEPKGKASAPTSSTSATSKRCPKISAPAHAENFSCGEQLQPGAECEAFTCALGYGRSGKFVCAANGTMTALGSCVRNSFEVDLAAVPHYNSSILSAPHKRTLTANATAAVACETGWRAIGELRTPTCAKIRCNETERARTQFTDAVLKIKGSGFADAEVSHCGSIEANATCGEYKCKIGYEPVGSFQCAADGGSFQSVGKCERKKCSVPWSRLASRASSTTSSNNIKAGRDVFEPANSVNWNVETPFLVSNQTRHLQCKTGYLPNGKFTCNAAGDNVTEVAFCERQYCTGILYEPWTVHILPPPNSVNFTCGKIASGENCTLHCGIGYEVVQSATGSGNSHLFLCNADASNVTHYPTCSRKSLEAVPPANAALPFPCAAVKSNSSCQHNCSLGYRVRGKFAVDANGTNFTEVGFCERKACTGIQPPQNVSSASFKCGRIESGSACSVICAAGFDAVGEFRCSASGDEVVSTAKCTPSRLFLSVVRRRKTIAAGFEKLVRRMGAVASRLRAFSAEMNNPEATRFPGLRFDVGDNSNGATRTATEVKTSTAATQVNRVTARYRKTAKQLAKVAAVVAANRAGLGRVADSSPVYRRELAVSAAVESLFNRTAALEAKIEGKTKRRGANATAEEGSEPTSNLTLAERLAAAGDNWTLWKPAIAKRVAAVESEWGFFVAGVGADFDYLLNRTASRAITSTVRKVLESTAKNTKAN